MTTAQARIGELGPSTVPLHPIANTGRLLDVGLPDLRRIALDVTCAGIRAADPAAAVDRLVDVRGGTVRASGRQINLDAARSVVMLGAGKASVALVGAVKSRLGRRVSGGLVVRPKGAGGRTAAVAGAFIDSDGSDGCVDATTGPRARQGAVDLDEAIARNDAYPALRQLGNLKVTGPTGTNVSDLWTIVIGPQRAAGGAGGLS